LTIEKIVRGHIITQTFIVVNAIVLINDRINSCLFYSIDRPSKAGRFSYLSISPETTKIVKKRMNENSMIPTP
jgi:hypothetical protein